MSPRKHIVTTHNMRQPRRFSSQVITTSPSLACQSTGWISPCQQLFCKLLASCVLRAVALYCLAMARFPIFETLNGEPPQPTWLVPNMLTAGSMLVLAGTAGTGKSFLTYYISMALASGSPVLGNATQAARVLVFDQENNSHDLAAYLYRLWAGMGRPDPALLERNLRIESFSLSSPSPGHYGEMMAAAIDYKPALIVIDTATPVLRITDENNNSEASAAIRQLRSIRASSGGDTSMIVLKHAKWSYSNVKDEPPRLHIRGASCWAGELDAVWLLRAGPGRPNANGLRPTFLSPDKVRAWGLKRTVKITPVEVPDGGIALSPEPQN